MRLPPSWKLKRLRLRWFFKEALRGFLPDAIISKSKHGFGLPFGVWAQRHAALRELATESLRSLATDEPPAEVSARLLATAPTGNGRRQSFRHNPLPRMTNTLLLAGPHDPDEIIRSTKRGVYAKRFSGGQVNISNGDFVFSLTESYLIEDGRLTAPLKGVNLIGNGPEVMRKVTMLGRDMELSDGIWTCGKDGQSVPVGVACPTIKISAITVGGTQR